MTASTGTDERAVIEKIARNWAGCIWEDVDIGASILSDAENLRRASLGAAQVPAVKITDAQIGAWLAEAQGKVIGSIPQHRYVLKKALACRAYGGSGWLGGPSFYDPGEGGEPCPDCNRAGAAQVPAPNPNEGAWRSCTGCHETKEGRDTGRFSTVLKCAVGAGCEECGWVGAIWDTTDYSAMTESAGAAQVPSLSEQDRHQGEVAVLEAAIASTSGHLGALIDELRGMVAQALKTTTALHNVATPDEDTPDLDARIPADDFRKFVDAHAALLRAFAPHKDAAITGSQPSQQGTKS